MGSPNRLAGRDAPGSERVWREPKLRLPRVERSERVTPAMLRVTLSGEDLADFDSLGFDDHVKLFVPRTDERRDCTPRRFDAAARTPVLDFSLHEAGPATRWALVARPGNGVRVGGPKGSAVASADVRRWPLVGDETAPPAIGRRIEEAGAGTGIAAVVAVADAGGEQRFDTVADQDLRWVQRPPSAANDPAPLIAALHAVELAPDTFAWIAAEARVARAVRDHIVGDRGHPRGWTKAGGYWMTGRADAHERIG